MALGERLLVIQGETLGRGDDGLGATLMGSFLRKLCLAEVQPRAIVFYNAGVRLMARGSAVLDALAQLESMGVELVACGTCVSFYGLGESMAVGHVGNMAEIANLMMTVRAVVTV